LYNKSSFFYSSNGGNSWSEQSNGLKSGLSRDLDINFSFGTRLIADSYRSILKWVNPLALPSLPFLLNPPNSSSDQSVDLTLSWNTSVNAETYRLQLSKDSMFTSIYFDDSVLTATSKQITDLDAFTKYYWRVGAKNKNGASNWSDVWNFKTGKITSVNSKDDVTSIFALSANYPNPFNPTTTISYSIPKTSFISLKIYDILGREIATLVDEEKQFGNYEVKFDGNNFTNGIYFYRMQVDNFSETKKFILLK